MPDLNPTNTYREHPFPPCPRCKTQHEVEVAELSDGQTLRKLLIRGDKVFDDEGAHSQCLVCAYQSGEYDPEKGWYRCG